MRKWLLVIILAVPVVIFAAPILLVYFMLSGAPIVAGGAPADSDDAQRVQNVIARYGVGAASGAKISELRVSEKEVESLLAFTARGIKSARAAVVITDNGLDARLSITLPANPFGRYANFSFNILPSEHGLEISRVTAGETNLPPRMLLFMLRYGFDILFGSEESLNIVETLQAVRFSGPSVIIVYRPTPGLKERLIAKIQENDQLRIGDPERVQIYFSRLQEVAAKLRGGYVSLSRYVAPVFELALNRQAAGAGDARKENEAAILALAIYFGDDRIEKLLGDAQGKYFSGSRLGSYNVTLKGRHDLVQHYLTSAGLQIAAGEGVANAIGEFKEIADALTGGSGFSFSDIAADRAGVTLAERAMSAKTARRIQEVLAGASSEAVFFPDISGLPDNMSQAEFERRYGGVESPRYRELMAEIERRIVQAPAYRDGS